MFLIQAKQTDDADVCGSVTVLLPLNRFLVTSSCDDRVVILVSGDILQKKKENMWVFKWNVLLFAVVYCVLSLFLHVQKKCKIKVLRIFGHSFIYLTTSKCKRDVV